MGVKSVSVAGALSHTDTLEIFWHSLTRVLHDSSGIHRKQKTYKLSKLYSTNVYIENRWNTALKLLENTARTQIVLSPETPGTLYNYIYLEDNTAYGAKYW